MPLSGSKVIQPSCSRKLCRNLFGPVDHEQLQKDFQSLMKVQLDEAQQKWNFDFETGTPLEGNYKWEKVSHLSMLPSPDLLDHAKENSCAGEKSRSSPALFKRHTKTERPGQVGLEACKADSSRSLKRKQTSIKGHFLSSEILIKKTRKRKAALMKATSNLSLEEVNIEEKKHFKAFINQLGADNVFEDESEIWMIWVKLWEAEAHLLGSLKEFLAKMTHLIKEAKHEKEKIQILLKIQISDHNKKVQKLYEEMEQQIEKEKQKLQNESKVRSQLHYVEMQEELDVREQEIQHFFTVQKELETQLLSLKEKQLVDSTQTQQLKRIKSSLENQLQQTLRQLQKTERCVDVMKDRISQLHSEGRIFELVEGKMIKGHFQTTLEEMRNGNNSEVDRQMEEDTNKVPHSVQDPVNLDETIYSQQEENMEYSLNEDKVESSLQQASDNVTSMTEADVESSRRVISIEEEDPLIELYVDEEQYFPQEPSDQKSLFKELNEAIAALSKVPGSHYQEIDDFGFQQQESLDQIKHHESSQQEIKLNQMSNSPIKGCSTNNAVQNRISEVPSDQASSQAGSLREGPADVRVRDLEMKKTNFSKLRQEVKTPQPMLGESFVSIVQPLVYSDLATQAGDYKETPVEREILVSEEVTKPEHNNNVLKHSDAIQVQQLPIEEDVAKLSAEMKMPDRRASQTQRPLLKDMPPDNFLSRVALSKLQAGHRPSRQLPNLFEPETQTQFSERLEMGSSENRREGCIAPSECKKDQEVSAECNEETSVRSEVCDCQMNKGTYEDTAILYSHPDHLYNVLFVGASSVGKTSFLNRLQNDSFDGNVSATIGMDYQIKNLFLDNKHFALRLWDTAAQERYHSITKQFFRKADGVVLMYDITSEYSFTDVPYWLNCVQEGAEDGVIVLLLGNKTDCNVERRVSVEDGAHLAKVCELPFYECSAASGHNVTESIVQLVRLMKTQEDQLKKKVLELQVPLKNKRSCCL